MGLFDSITDIFNDLAESPSDSKLICNILNSEYNANRALLETLSVPKNVYIKQIEWVYDYFEEPMYPIINGILNQIDMKYEEVIDKDIVMDLVDKNSLLNIKEKNICNDFHKIVPGSLANLILDVEFDFFNNLGNLLNLPSDIVTNLAKNISKIKSDLLKEMLGEYFTRIVQPIFEYDEFLKSNKIKDKIKTLERLERCLTNKDGCGKDPKHFSSNIENKPWSLYYNDQFYINSNGKFNMAALAENEKKYSHIKEIYSRSKRYL